MNTHLIKTVSVGNDFEQAMNDLIESKINNRPTKQRFKVSELKKQIEERIKLVKRKIKDIQPDFVEDRLAIRRYKEQQKWLESLNVSDNLPVTVKHLLPHGKTKREWTVCFLDYCLFTEPTEKACYKRIENELKCGDVSDYVKKADVTQLNNLLQDKRDAFIGNCETSISMAENEGFKQGLDWSIETIKTWLNNL